MALWDRMTDEERRKRHTEVLNKNTELFKENIQLKNCIKELEIMIENYKNSVILFD